MGFAVDGCWVDEDYVAKVNLYYLVSVNRGKIWWRLKQTVGGIVISPPCRWMGRRIRVEMCA